MSLYLELPVMMVMTFTWYFIRHRREFSHLHQPERPTLRAALNSKRVNNEVVDINTVDLYSDEHVDDEYDGEDDALRAARRKGRWGWLWRLYDIVA